MFGDLTSEEGDSFASSQKSLSNTLYDRSAIVRPEFYPDIDNLLETCLTKRTVSQRETVYNRSLDEESKENDEEVTLNLLDYSLAQDANKRPRLI
jgi:hypothetical protein